MAEEENLLLSGLKNGDKRVFTLIYKQYSEGLFGLALRYLKDYDLAEDVLQQVFMQLWKVHEEISINKDLGFYLFKMTKNAVLKTLKEQNSKVIDAYELEYYYKSTSEVEENELMIDKRLKAVYAIIEKLPPKTKSVFLMKIKENLNDEDIAGRMGLSLQTVKNYYTQALKFLRRHLRPIHLLFILEITLIFLYNA